MIDNATSYVHIGIHIYEYIYIFALNQKAKDDLVPSPETDRLVAALPPEALSKDEAQREAAEAETEAGPMAAEAVAKVMAEREAAKATAAALHVKIVFIPQNRYKGSDQQQVIGKENSSRVMVYMAFSFVCVSFDLDIIRYLRPPISQASPRTCHPCAPRRPPGPAACWLRQC